MLHSHPVPADSPIDQPSRHIMGLIFELARQLGTGLDRAVVPYNVTGQQAALLLLTSRDPGVTLSQLAPCLATDNAGVTRLVDRLEAKGLATRRPSASDRRAVIVELTADGVALIPALVAAFDEVMSQLTAGFEGDELDRVAASMARLLGNLEEAECGQHHPTSSGRPAQ